MSPEQAHVSTIRTRAHTQVYTIYSILFIVFLILIIVTSFITVALTYFQLAGELSRCQLNLIRYLKSDQIRSDQIRHGVIKWLLSSCP